MRKLTLLLALVVIVAAVPLLFRDGEQAPRPLQNLPWQIEVLPGGGSRVFGITLGQATLGDVRAQLGDDMELAIIVRPGETTGGLEMYYSRYMAGPFSGKLVVAADVEPGTLTGMRERAVAAEYMKSAARKFRLDPADLPLAWAARVRGLTFVPTASLGEEAARKRFGSPATVVTSAEGVAHWLYPDKGLDLMLADSGKAVLQYVAPARFSMLSEPLAAPSGAE